MAIKFDGSTGYLSYPGALQPAFPLTIVQWVSADYTGNPSYGAAQSNQSASSLVATYFDANVDGAYAQYASPGNSSALRKSNPAVSSSTMQLVVAVFSSSSARKVYSGSSTPVTETYEVGGTISAHDFFSVGAVKTGGTATRNFFKGSIAEVYVFDTAMTDAQVANLLAGAAPETIAGLVDGWKLDTFNAGGTYTSIGGTRTLTAVGGVTASALAHPVTRAGGGGGGGGVVAPTITTQPSNQSVTAPAPATFNVTATDGGGTLSYQWKKGGVAITGATSASYTTPATATADSGSSFTVTVTNSANSVTSSAATLTVAAASPGPSPSPSPGPSPAPASPSANTIVGAPIVGSGNTLLTSGTIPFVAFLNVPGLTTAVIKANVAINSSSLAPVTDPALTPGSTYLRVLCDATGAAFGAEPFVAS